MSDETEAHGFGEHHQRHVRTTFQYIDKLLSEAEHTMADAAIALPDAFGRYHADSAQGDARLYPPNSRSNAARDGGAEHSAV